jgi:hypothetical protein
MLFAAIACMLQALWGVMNSDVTPVGSLDFVALYLMGMMFAAGIISLGWFFKIVWMNGRSTYDEFSIACGYAIRAFQGLGVGCVAYVLFCVCFH